MNESVITSKGRTTLPKAVREALSVQAGDRVRYVILDEAGCMIMPVRPYFSPVSQHWNMMDLRLTAWRKWTAPSQKGAAKAE